MNKKAARGHKDGLPMPLWLQGAIESAQVVIISAILVILPLLGIRASGGMSDPNLAFLARLAGQLWLVIHGVPLTLTFTDGPSSASVHTGTLSLLPLGLTLIPFLLSWRAGRRLARASYTDQLWQALLGAFLVYAGAGLATAFVCSIPGVQAPLLASALIPLLPAGLGFIIGARREAGSWSRLIGVNAVDWIANTSQHQRWAGSYLWSVAKSGLVAAIAALGLASLLLGINLATHWTDIVDVYQGLNPGALGGSALTLAQLGFIPNLAIWTLAWSSGSGFALGVGSTVTPLATAVAPVPPIPILAALPVGDLSWGSAALLIPVLGGVLAGWWFIRCGENHFDEWLSLKIRLRWFSLPVSTVVLAAAIGAVAGILSGVLCALASGSAGIGRLTDLGPEPFVTGLWVAAEVGVGVVIGSLAGPWLERSQERPLARTGRE